MKKIILFELNEVPFSVLDDYCSRFPESSLAVFYRQSKSIETIASDGKELHPWSTWPTLHRGVEPEKHMLTNLSQDLTEVDDEFPPLWKLLANKNIKVGLGGSLHSWPMPENLDNYAFYLPDTFANDGQAYPSELEVFQKFNLSMVDKSARNVSQGVAFQEALNVLKAFRKLGFSASTILTISRQLASEVSDSARKGRRRIMQGVLAFDVFMKQLEDKKPDFVTFFSNHVASSMHRYWAASYPEDFDENEYSKEWIDKYKGEIDFSLDITSKFIERLMKFTALNPDYQIMLTTSMGQAAFDGTVVERQVYVKKPDIFMKAMGVVSDNYSQRRVMAPRFAVMVDKDKLPLFQQNMETLKVSGETIRFEIKSAGFCMMHFGQVNLKQEEEYVDLQHTRYSFEEFGLQNMMIEDNSASTGYHIPQGILLIYDPQCKKGQNLGESIATTEIAPIILQNYGLPLAEYMVSPSSFLR
ncbi:MAG: hypothetical protein HAW67_04995 [Endozoicomonadaceae bacterium]|nr:hypothetical protein [Endozoicomonadaceae bacterium]